MKNIICIFEVLDQGYLPCIRYNFWDDFIKEKIFVMDVHFKKILRNQEKIASSIKYHWI